MLRTFLIWLSKAAWAQKLVTNWKFAWRAASRFVAGTTIQDAIGAVSDLNAKGMNVTLDHLGESTTNSEEACRSTEDILDLLDAIQSANVRANVSVKLTQIGLSLDECLCARNLEQILERAKKYDNFVRIDMEDTPFTDKTIKMYRLMREKGYEKTGLVIQSYLYRSQKDTRDLLADGTHIRLVKGAYKEPSDLAFPRKKDVDANYDLLARYLIDASISDDSPELSSDGRIPPIPALGTHDLKRIEAIKEYAEKKEFPKRALEFQMLYGIRRDIQSQLVKEGFPVRVYVPYGTHWYPYYMRRMAERPANMWFFVSNFFRN